MYEEPLDAAIIQNQLTANAQKTFPTIVIFPTISSTNTYLLNLPPLEQHSGYVCIAEHQTAGRGRQGRQWISPPMQNIYLSALWKIAENQNLSGLSLVVGMAIINALKKIGLHQAQIKWPNDILVNDLKLAGILLESSNLHYMVIGIGMNVYMNLDTEVGRPWTSIAQLRDNPPSRNRLISHVLNALAEELQEFSQHGLQSLCADWSSIDALKNKPIILQQGSRSLKGIAQGINQEGALLISVAGKTMPIYTGEVSKILVQS